MVAHNKYSTVLLLLLLFFSLLVLTSCQPQQETIKIGAVIDLSGAIQYFGQEANQGLHMALEDINKGSKIPFELIIEDSKAQPEQALTAAQKLINVDDVHYLVTFSGASAALAILPLANEQEIIQMELICYVPGCHTKDDYLFCVSGAAHNAPDYMAEDILSLGYETIALIYVQNDLGESMRQRFTEQFTKLGGNVLFEEAFEQEQTDFRTQLLKIPEIDAIVTFTFEEIGHLLQDKNELGIETPVYAFFTVTNPQAKDIAGTGLEGVYTAYPGHIKTNAHKTFAENYAVQHGRNPSIHALKAYDALTLLYKAIETCDYAEDTTCVKEQLEQTQNYEGVSTIITFDECGDLIEETFHREQFVNGSWRILS
ncbi:hypothetical protein COV18_04275 [Candidatus Woesearchaeota archaeon CG10_big_fil_rev_8_21_14_0_10_37_12]|nr:MAG: hypothetical protein COV18_04275 [Candidatus Woesearchaeota archaeon CG10_big_fil_rev_8_21_14_0_10_37_12]